MTADRMAEAVAAKIGGIDPPARVPMTRLRLRRIKDREARQRVTDPARPLFECARCGRYHEGDRHAPAHNGQDPCVESVVVREALRRGRRR